MTLQQQAYTMIDQLTEDNVKDVIQYMTTMLAHSNSDCQTIIIKTKEKKKLQACFKLQSLRRKIHTYAIDDCKAERECAMLEKYGEYMQAQNDNESIDRCKCVADLCNVEGRCICNGSGTNYKHVRNRKG